MTVELTGMAEIQAEIERRLGTQRMQQISDVALKSAAQVFVNELKSQFQTFADTRASLEEITSTEPHTENGVRKITVHWKGPKGRYRIIHLNEFGTVKNPNPRGKGAIAKALRNSETAYKNTIEQILRGAF